MICTSFKECIEKTHHAPVEEKSGKRGKKGKAQKTVKRGTDTYKLPLCQSPCKDRTQQERCIQSLDDRPLITCVENGKSYTLDQKEEYPRREVLNLHMDGGVITDAEGSSMNRCDYVVIVKEKGASKGKTAILVELKGVSVQHAIKQIMATLGQPEFQAEWAECDRMFGRIICTSVPRAMTNDARIKAMKEFLNRGGNLVIKEQSYTEEYRKMMSYGRKTE